jgi:hypothetical protein
MPTVGIWGDEQLRQKSTKETGTRNETKTCGGKPKLVLYVAECREDHTVGGGNAKRTRHQQKGVCLVVA